jgi:hypothetical protein
MEKTHREALTHNLHTPASAHTHKHKFTQTHKYQTPSHLHTNKCHSLLMRSHSETQQNHADTFTLFSSTHRHMHEYILPSSHRHSTNAPFPKCTQGRGKWLSELERPRERNREDGERQEREREREREKGLGD